MRTCKEVVQKLGEILVRIEEGTEPEDLGRDMGMAVALAWVLGERVDPELIMAMYHAPDCEDRYA